MKTKIVIILLSTIIFASCEDWLQPEPLSIYTPENIYIDKAGLETALVPLRRSLRTSFCDDAAGGAAPTIIAIELMSSDYGVAGETNAGMAQDYITGVHPTGQAAYFTSWKAAWDPIKNANTIISRIDAPNWSSPDEKNEILAEAYFHRAYWYYLLVHQYGDVPFINKEHTSPKIDFYTHSKTTILKKLQEDLEFSALYMPKTVKPGQVNRAAAMHLLVKIYLANNEYDKAITTATNVIENSTLALMTNRFGSVANDSRFNVIWDLHRPENKSLSTNIEGILVCQDKYGYSDIQSRKGSYTQRSYTPWWSHSLWLKDPDGKRACVDTPNDPQILALGRGVGLTRPGDYLNYDIWKDCGADLRHDADTNWLPVRKIYINNPQSKYFGQPVDFKYSNPDDSIRVLYPWPYYKIYIPDALRPTQPMGGHSDWYVFRLAETYLLRAEAYYWKGDKKSAASDINVIRSRVNAPVIDENDVTIDYILDERARELYLEEHRKVELTRVALIMAARGERGYGLDNFHENSYWYDRVIQQGKFYNRGIVWATYEYRIRPYHVFWPIPQTSIDANSKGHINQNKGYDGSETNIAPLTEITDNQ